MVNRPSVPEVITVNSEELQTVVRDLLPSQNGFGSELQASNIITPIIDLTATAEGSRLPGSMQQAFDFSSTPATADNGTVTLINQTVITLAGGLGVSTSNTGLLYVFDAV